MWTVWIWKDERHKEREHENREATVRFLTGLLHSAQELQRRLYGILAEDELAFYRAQYPEPCQPASPPAIDLLFGLAQLFGWAAVALRYGQFSRDRHVIEKFGRIAETLESRTLFAGDAFRLTVGERVALGRVALRRVGPRSATNPTLAVVSRFEFEAAMCGRRHARLFGCKAVRRILDAVDGADRPEALEGRERLAAVQNLLVDLLAYLDRAGQRVYGPRTPVGGRQLPLQPPKVRLIHQVPGRLRLGVPQLLTDPACVARLRSALESLEQVSGFRVNALTASVVIWHGERGAQLPGEIMAAIEAALARKPVRGASRVHHPEPRTLSGTGRRQEVALAVR